MIVFDEASVMIADASETITSDALMPNHKRKGGEKRMASEWEELEKLTKDELIIELIKERNIHRRINRAVRLVVDFDYPEDRRLPVYDDEGSELQTTTDEWARKVIAYATKKTNDPEYTDVEICMLYGLDSDQYDRIIAESDDGSAGSEEAD